MTARIKPKWKLIVPGPNGLCECCGGTGSEWPRRMDGGYDRRYHWPIGPCTAGCVRGGWVDAEGATDGHATD
jgi:hypothetical protein